MSATCPTPTRKAITCSPKRPFLTPCRSHPPRFLLLIPRWLPQRRLSSTPRPFEDYFGQKQERFDLVLLGLGDNSHTASLFPHTPVLHETGVGAKEVFVEEKKAYRITLTAPLINQAQAIAFLVYGADKAAAVQRVLTAERNVEEFPAQLIAAASGELQWFLDAAAAAQLPDSQK